jgi:hypothetical protein
MVLAWTPFIDPLSLHVFWWAFLVPLALGISVAYKAVRMRSLRRYVAEVLVMTVQIVLAMAALGAAGFVFVQFLLPMAG